MKYLDYGKYLQNVHYSKKSGVHTNVGSYHVPYQGQTTLQTFKIAGTPSALNDLRLSRLGGTLRHDKAF